MFFIAHGVGTYLRYDIYIYTKEHYLKITVKLPYTFVMHFKQLSKKNGNLLESITNMTQNDS